jgi:PAS domain S-box-containing protein
MNLKRRELLLLNGKVYLVYLIGLLISLLLFSEVSQPYLLWIPLGTSVGFILMHGIKVLPSILFGLVTSSIIMMVYKDMSIQQNLLFALLDFFVYSMVIIFGRAGEWKKYVMMNERISLQFLLSLLFLVLLYSVSIIAIQFGFNAFFYSYQTLVLQVFLIKAIALLVFSSLIISLHRREPFFGSINKRILFNIVLLALVFFALLILNYYSIIPASLVYFFLIPFFLYSSYRFSTGLFSLFFAASVTLLFLITFQKAQANIYELTTNQVEALGLLLISFLSANYLNLKTQSKKNVVETMKVQFDMMEEEISKRTNEYKLVATKLFDEINKRNKAERLLKENRFLLAEAQSIGGIAAWEYLIDSKTFKWVEGSGNPQISNGSITTDELISKLHPEDIPSLKSLMESNVSKIKSFDTEARIMQVGGAFGTFQIKGRFIAPKGQPPRFVGLMVDISAQKQREKELREKEQKYVALFESNIDAVCVINADSLVIVEVNKAFTEMYGYAADEVLGKNYSMLSVDPDETKMAIRNAKQKGFFRVTNRVHKSKDGASIYLQGSLMRHAVNGNDLIFIISHDITMRKKAEMELVQREQKLRAFFDSNLMGMGETNIAREWIHYNQKLLDILGYSAKELLTLTWDMITYPDDLEGELKLFNKLLTHETTSYTLEKRLITKSKELVYCRVSVSVIRSINGTISHFVQIVDDISDKRANEEELKQSQRRLQRAQTVAKIGSIWFYPNSDNVKLSDEANSILGISSKTITVTRKDLFKMSIPSEKGRFVDLICKLEACEKVQGNFNQTIVTPKGELRHLLLNFGATEKNGEVVEVIVTMADVTQMKETEYALSQANALKDQLFSIIAHDLRSPIGALAQLATHFVQNRKELDESDTNNVLELLQKTSVETYNLLEELLEWARSQQNQTIRPVEANLPELIRDVVQLSSSIAVGKGISISLSIPAKAKVIADVEMVKTIIRNLISNSIKFTPQGGVVTVTLEVLPNFIEVSVSDTGIGISEDKVKVLFDDDFTHTTPGTNNEKGFGLGLKMVKTLVERNGGSLGVQSIIGQGSVFQFTLPRSFD